MTHPQQDLDGTAVALYTQPGCGQCVFVKLKLKKDHVEFTEIDISQDETAEAYIRDLGYLSLPVVYVSTEFGDVHWHGNNPDKYQQYITDARWP